jgi:hypothetical protein
MACETYKQAYATAKLDLLERLQGRDDLDQQIRKLKQTVKTLGEPFGFPAKELDKLLLVEGFPIDAKPGFTETIRRPFRITQFGAQSHAYPRGSSEEGDRRGRGEFVVVHSYSFAPHGRSRRS